MTPQGVSVIHLAAYLGVSRQRVQKIITDHGIEPVGRRWKANLYDPLLVIGAAQSGKQDA